MTDNNFHIADNGDSALTVLFNEDISEKLSRRILQVSNYIKKEPVAENIIEIIPGYKSLTVCYKPLAVSEDEIKTVLHSLLTKELPSLEYQSRTIEIPVCYENIFAPDLSNLADHCRISVEEVIRRHTQATYLVHMLGFLPGFVFLGGLDSRLNCPRKKSPAKKVLKGSVGIGGNQTGIYPVNSPGGWNIIGRTPRILFNAELKNPFSISPLDKIKFVSITNSEFENINREHQ